MADTTIPVGLCQCGCGQRTPLASQTRADRGQRKGEPVAFVTGAHGRRAAARDLAERFWEKVRRSDGCWLWLGNRNADGYGQFKMPRGNARAHRVAYELVHGPIPAGQDILHTCDNPPCVRPDHLLAGTHLENMRDMVAKGRKNPALGAHNGKSKLTAAQVEEIRFSPLSRAELARRFGVSWTSVDHVRRGKNWKQRGAA